MRAVGVVLAAALVAAPARAAPVKDDSTLPQVEGDSVLERTLQVDTDAPLRNDELLLETRDTGMADAAPAAPRPAPDDLPAAVLPPLAAPPAAPATRPPPREAVPGWLREAALVLREHRDWLLGGMAAVAVVVGAAALWQRRRTGTAERQLKALDAARRASSGRRRRRSSRH